MVILGHKAFAAICAVEGLKLSEEGQQRLDLVNSGKITHDECRKQIIQAYTRRFT